MRAPCCDAVCPLPPFSLYPRLQNFILTPSSTQMSRAHAKPMRSCCLWDFGGQAQARGGLIRESRSKVRELSGVGITDSEQNQSCVPKTGVTGNQLPTWAMTNRAVLLPLLGPAALNAPILSVPSVVAMVHPSDIFTPSPSGLQTPQVKS